MSQKNYASSEKDPVSQACRHMDANIDRDGALTCYNVLAFGAFAGWFKTFQIDVLKSKKDILSDFLSFTPSIPLKIFLVSAAVLGTRFPPLCAQLIAQYTQSHTASISYVSRHTTASISCLYESYRKDTTNTKTSIYIY